MAANSWKLQDAKARFSEVVRKAREGEPQEVTVTANEPSSSWTSIASMSKPKEAEPRDDGGLLRGLEEISTRFDFDLTATLT